MKTQIGRLVIAIAMVIVSATTIQAVDIIWSDLSSEQILRGPINGAGPVIELYDIGDYPGPPKSFEPSAMVIDGSWL